MAKAAKEYTLNVGDKVTFVKYGQALEPGQKPLFKKGEEGTIVSQDELSKDPKDPYETYTVKNAKGEKESLFFPDEIAVAKAGKTAAKEAAPVKAEKAPAKKAAAKTEAKAKAPAKAAKAALPVAAEAEGEDELIITDQVASLIEGQSAVEAARELLQGVSTSYFTLGGVLAHIQVTGGFKDVQIGGEKKGKTYDDFFAFCAGELGQEKAKVYQLIRIYRKLTAAGVDETRFIGVGWTYARAMSNVITADNADDLLAQAAEMKRDAFEDYVTETYVQDGAKGTKGERIKRTRFSFSLHGDQGDTVTKALTKLSKKLGLPIEDVGPLFHHLAVAFLQEEGQTTLAEDMQYVAQTHKVELQVVKPEAKAKAPAKAPAKAAAKAAPAKKSGLPKASKTQAKAKAKVKA